jgi:large subunit ribosomal protein L13
MVTVLDAEGMLLGRLSSIAAKRSLNGEEIAIVNAEKAVISGSKVRVRALYLKKRQRGSVEGGPFFPRRPDHILKRTIRGMVPYKRERGADAMRRIKVYVGVPTELVNAPRVRCTEADANRLSTSRYTTLGEVSTFLGARF